MDRDSQKRKRLNVRVEPELHQRVSVIAERKFEGKEAMAFRDALEVYADLHERLGAEFEPTITRILAPEPIAA